jgi:hypothetical protein
VNIVELPCWVSKGGSHEKVIRAQRTRGVGPGPCRASEADEQPPPSNRVHTWNELALDTVRIGQLSDAQASRLYAMVNVAMYFGQCPR